MCGIAGFNWPDQRLVKTMMDALLMQTRLTYVDCLAALYIADASTNTNAQSGAKVSDEANALQTEKQDGRVKAMLEQLSQVKPGDDQN